MGCYIDLFFVIYLHQKSEIDAKSVEPNISRRHI